MDVTRSGMALFGVASVATAGGVFALDGVDEDEIGAWGLISVYPGLTMLALAVLLATLALALSRQEEEIVVLSATIVGITVLLYAAPTIVESAARFPTAWVHSSFADHISLTGELRSDLDARFAWPGFFTAGSALTGVAGAGSARIWLPWAPLALVLSYLPSLLAIGRATLGGWRAPWLGLAVFLVANWVGQDYFAPQSVSLSLYLAMIALLLAFLRRTTANAGPLRAMAMSWQTNARGIRAGIGRALSPELDPDEPVTRPATRVGLILAIAVGCLTVATSHQLTPIVLVGALAGFALFGRVRPWPLMLFGAVATGAWLSIVGEPYWRGHFGDIFGSLGQVDSIVDSGVQERILGSPTHLMVISVRIRFALAVWGLAGLAILLGLKRGRTSVPLVILTTMPGFMILAGSYGGEGFLRMYLFSLVGSALLIASLAFPDGGGRWLSSRAASTVAVTLLALAIPVFLVARYGNESFERISAAEMDATDALYRLAGPGARVVPLAQGGALGANGRFTYQFADPLLSHISPSRPDLSAVEAHIGRSNLGVYVVSLRSQVEYGVQNEDLPPAWGADIVSALLASGRYVVAFRNSESVILQQLPVGT